jgi:xanthine dehydrogenase YagS FAD-binding subunit
LRPFSFGVAGNIDHALEEIGPVGGGRGGGMFIAGGTSLLDLMKHDVLRPVRLVDINQLLLKTIEETAQGGLLIGALAKNEVTAWHPLVREQYPLLKTAILAGASPQIRNMASIAGNLLQRTRCHYYHDTGVPCNKREPGSGCPAVAGLARHHAILGASERCIAAHPSDLGVALAALAASVHLRSPRGSRVVPLAGLYRPPGDNPTLETILDDDELITHIELPPAQGFAYHSAFLKLRERASQAFAIVSVAALLDIGPDGRIREARIALGGVAHKPWRRPEAEALLAGQLASAAADPAVASAVADCLLEGACSYGSGVGSNSFKILMARRAIVRALAMALAGQAGETGQDDL